MTDDQSLDDFCESLQALKPMQGELDVRHVFFEAGRQATQTRRERGTHLSSFSFVAAAIAGVLISAPLAYRAGRMDVQPENNLVVDRDSPEANVAADSQTAAEESTGLFANQQTGQPGRSRPKPVIANSPSSRTIERQGTLASSFASWFALDQRITATRLDRATQSTLSAFHSSLVSTDAPLKDLAGLPAATLEPFAGRASQPDPFNSEQAREQVLAIRPFALGDQQMVFLNLEESR